MAKLFLIPVTLGDTDLNNVLPSQNYERVKHIRHFIVEEVRTARRFLRRCDPTFDIDACQFYPLNKYTSVDQIAQFLDPIKKGIDVGLMSEAGCPAVADPGADIVAIAQTKGIQVVPLVGPSSILLSLMGSGFNGQSFAFLGYLPIDAEPRAKQLKVMEHRIYQEEQTQIFIETPYRNDKLVEELIRVCRPQSKLCIAADLTLDTEYIQTKTLASWKKEKWPSLHKRPVIFLLYK